jgi:hypothetical protein
VSQSDGSFSSDSARQVLGASRDSDPQGSTPKSQISS